jgi:arachidonate 15-lipoxygenase
MTAFLPQHEPFFPGLFRKLRLMWDRRLYQYDYTHVAPLAILKDLPITDQFSFDWLVEVSKRIITSLENRAELELGEQIRLSHSDKLNLLNKLVGLGETSIFEIKKLVTEALHFDGRFGAPATPAQSLKEYAELFRTIGLPPIHKDFMNDRSFAAQRVAGPNPLMLQRMKALDGRLPITSAMFQTAVRHNSPGSNDSLDAALAEGRLYLADYALLNGAEMGVIPNGQKYLYAPLAMFVITGPKKELLPVAIQCQQTPAADNPIFTPNDGYNWQIAKTIVEVADGSIHEASSHLGRTHLAMEAFVLASYRQLAENHPLSRLLWPHFEGTLAINNAAWKHLVSDRGAVDKLMAGSIQASRGVAAAGLQSLSVMDDLLPKTFARRGIADREAFPEYPYRDDSLLYWDVIHEWVAAYLRIYYQTDTDIQQDTELQAWGRELVSKSGGRLRGLPNNGAIQRIEELIDVVTFVIYTCSVQHAAVNFPQYDCMSYVPNLPLAGYRPAPTSKTGATEADFVAMLPTLDMAELQMEVCYLLGSVHYTELGQYGQNHFRDPRVAAPLQQFQKRLADIGPKIAERNQTRRPYETLAPQGIPQSINI